MEAAQDKRDIQTEITFSMLSVRVAEIRGAWFENRNSLVVAMTAVEEAFNHLFATAAVSHVTTPGAEGVMDDSSYHFHGIQLLSSAYGDGWISTMLKQRSIAAGTRWALGAAGVGVLAQFLVEGDFALTFGRRWDFGTQGRGVDPFAHHARTECC